MIDLNGKLFAVMTMDEKARTFSVFLVNRTDKAYTNVIVRTGGWMSCADDLIQTSESAKSYGPLLPGAKIQVDQSDLGELDFVIWYRLKLTNEDGNETSAGYSIPKHGRVAQEYVEEFGATVGVMEVR